MVRGCPVTCEWMISDAYSRLRSISNGSPAASIRRISSYSSRFSSLRRTYSSTGTRKRSIIASSCRKQGRYSAECSLDSVGKRPNRRYISTRTRRLQLGVALDHRVQQRVEILAVARRSAGSRPGG